MTHRDFSHELPARTVFTVSGITTRIKSLLEESFSFVWVEGEISNLRIPSSGHVYFTVKDANAQIAAVMFKGQTKALKFAIKDGLSVTGLGRITVYEPRGSYQIIFEYLEPKGVGSLQLAFEQLKEKLLSEGLFDQTRKKPLPFMPSRISVITSPTGSVIRDIITVSKRRFPSAHIEVVPASVQGSSAASQLVEALRLLKERDKTDIIIIARGGGSIEDLAPFNTEELARAISASKIPVISAVGHETDFTICDFVADLRAPTPSAAAEIALPDARDLSSLNDNLKSRLINSFGRNINFHRIHYASLSKRLVDPRKKVQDLILKVDDLTARLHRAASVFTDKRKSRVDILKNRLISGKFVSDIRSLEYRRLMLDERLKASAANLIKGRKAVISRLEATLEALSPMSVLSRGYSITRTIPGNKVIHETGDVSKGSLIETVLYSGKIVSRVEDKEEK